MTLPKKLEPASPDAEAGDVADSEDVRRFLSLLLKHTFQFFALVVKCCFRQVRLQTRVCLVCVIVVPIVTVGAYYLGMRTKIYL